MSYTFIYISKSALALVLVVGVLSYVVVPEKARADITKRVYLTSGTTWTVPSDWNSSSNTIEAIGDGGNGGANMNGGGGGGGGAYAKISNLSLTGGASVSYYVNGAGDVVFNSTAITCGGSPTPSVCGQSGSNASGSTAGAGGLASASVGTTKYDGGPGESLAGGGGGAGGPFGAGVSGSSFGGGEGGNTYGGYGGGAGNSYCGDLDTDGGPGETGYPGYEYDTIPGHGSGGGGGPGGQGNLGFAGGNGGNGGNYGGGGGGGAARCGGSGSAGSASFGAGGIIVITYTSTESPGTSTAKFKILGGMVKIIGGRITIQ
jgi:hypothetical protein